MIYIKERVKKIRIIYNFVRKIKYTYRYIRGVYGETFLFYLKYELKKINVIKKDKYIESLKNKYVGRKIFIVATGPSLSIDMLNCLKDLNQISISCNGIFKVFNDTEWRPDYYIMDDYWLLEKYIKDYPDMRWDKVGLKGTIFSEKCKRFLDENMDSTGFVQVCYFDHWETHYSKKFKYDKMIEYGCYDFYTVTNTAITLADYMGASKVFLLGVDCDYTSGVLHSGEEKVDISQEQMKNNIDMENSMLNGYEKINSLIGNDIKIYNVNSGGKVNTFTRITFEEAINM